MRAAVFDGFFDYDTIVMPESDHEPLAQKKNPYWWMHPAYRGEQPLDLASFEMMSPGCFRWLSFADKDDFAADSGAAGRFNTLAHLLYQANGKQHGAVKDWYVIVKIATDGHYAVGQLRADARTPLQLFDDLVFASVGAARDCIQALRDGNKGGK